eukprot:4931474-Pyramimonas_sp.AAC.2
MLALPRTAPLSRVILNITVDGGQAQGAIEHILDVGANHRDWDSRVAVSSAAVPSARQGHCNKIDH